MKTVYWCDELSTGAFSTALKSPNLVPALSVVTPQPLFRFSLAHCPAWRDQLKNTFVVTSPINFTFETTGDGRWSFSSPEVPEQHATSLVSQEGMSVFQLLFQDMFFCETSLIATVRAPAMIGDTFHKKIDFIEGGYDVSKWFRPLNVPFQTLGRSPVQFHVARGEPLYFIRFDTSEDVQIKKFKLSPRLEELAFMCQSSKERASTAKGSRPLTFFYKLFTGRNMHREAMAEIKANLLP